jgi:putative transposase
MSQTTSPCAGKPYGLERVCRVLGFPRSTIYAQQSREAAKVLRLHPVRRGPKPTISDADLLAAIRADLAASPAKAIARCGRGCASCATSAYPGIASAA